MRVFFEKREEIAPSIWRYHFRPERAIDFEPGQYVDLHLKNVTDDPRGAARTFSMTSLPDEPSVTFILKHFGLQSPYKQALQNLKPDDEAKIDNAMGDLVLPKMTDIPLVFIAGGIGIASYAGMLKTLLKLKEERRIFFFYQLRNRHEQIFRDLTAAYPLELKQVSIAPNEVTASQIKSSTPPEALIYISGSQKFVETLQKEFESLGTPRQQIIFDYYDGYSEL